MVRFVKEAAGKIGYFHKTSKVLGHQRSDVEPKPRSAATSQSEYDFAPDPKDETLHSDHLSLFLPDAARTQLSVANFDRDDADDAFNDWSREELEEQMI
jgi:hypothetical protein